MNGRVRFVGERTGDELFLVIDSSAAAPVVNVARRNQERRIGDVTVDTLSGL